MTKRAARRRSVESEQWQDLLVLIEAAVALQGQTTAAIRGCLHSEGNPGADLGRQVGRVTSSYAYLIARVDELPPSVTADETARLLRYHHMLIAETARYAYNAPGSAPNSLWEFDGDLGPPAARLRKLRDLVAGFLERSSESEPGGAVRVPQALSHNLLTPLTTILGNVSSLVSPDVRWSPTSERHLLDGIANESLRLSRVVENVLTLALMSEGVLEPAFDWCDPLHLLTAAIDHLDPGLDLSSRVTVISKALPPDAPGVGHIWADHTLLQRALVDLLDNAARHPNRQGRVRVSLTDNGDTMSITIDDDGPGLPGSVRRAVAAATKAHVLPTSVGTGIPTAIGIIRLHDGSLTYATHESVSCCRIQLPTGRADI